MESRVVAGKNMGVRLLHVVTTARMARFSLSRPIYRRANRENG